MDATDRTTQDNATVSNNDEPELEMKAESEVAHITDPDPQGESELEPEPEPEAESEPEAEPEPEPEPESEPLVELRFEPESEQPELNIEPETEPDPEANYLPPPLLSPKSDVDFSYEAGKVSIKFLFANRDGLVVRIQCDMSDTVATVKGSLLSLWPEELDNCSEGGRIRLICMGRGILQPDSITLEQCDIPVFKTHATPINVSIRPNVVSDYGNVTKHSKNSSLPGRISSSSNITSTDNCCCNIQ